MPVKLSQDALDLRQRRAVHGCRFRFVNVVLHLCSDNRDHIETFRAVYGGFVDGAADGPALRCCMLDSGGVRGAAGLIIDSMLYDLPSGPAFMEKAEMMIFQRVLDRIENHLMLHSGVVSRDGSACIIYAPTGFGKTTFVMELVSRGYKFLSDEYCPVRMDDNLIMPFSRCIGVKPDSPFAHRCDRLKDACRAFDQKVYVDCDTLYPGSRGAACKAKHLIMLTSEFESGADHGRPNVFELVLFNDGMQAIKEICRYQDVDLLEEQVADYYTGCRLSLSGDSALTARVHAVLRKYGDHVLYVAPVMDVRKPDYARSPEIRPMAKSEAVLEIMSNLLNRSPTSRLLEQCGGKSYNLLMRVGQFVKDIRCYKMKPGVLAEMGDTVDNLWKGSQ